MGAATEKARAASAVCDRGTVNSGASEDRSDLVGGRSCSRSARYGGDDVSRVLNVKSAVLYRMAYQSRTWPDLGTQILPEPDLGRTCFSDNRKPCLMKLNAVSRYKQAVQFSAFFVTSLIASLWQNLCNGNKFCIFPSR